MNVRELLQPNIENSKQLEFYKTIEDVGLKIYTLKEEPDFALQDFVPFVDFIQDEKKQQDFIETISRLSQRYKIEGVDPDKLLFELHSFDKYIIFNDEEFDFDEYGDCNI